MALHSVTETFGPSLQPACYLVSRTARSHIFRPWPEVFMAKEAFTGCTLLPSKTRGGAGEEIWYLSCFLDTQLLAVIVRHEGKLGGAAAPVVGGGPCSVRAGAVPAVARRLHHRSRIVPGETRLVMSIDNGQPLDIDHLG